MTCCIDDTITESRGSDITFTLRWKNPDGTPFDLTGYTAQLDDFFRTYSAV